MSPISGLAIRDGDGRSARKTVPRRALADWNPDTRGHDALATILAQSEIRADADQNARDHAQLVQAIADGAVPTAAGWA
jgi:hypothetical protein